MLVVSYLHNIVLYFVPFTKSSLLRKMFVVMDFISGRKVLRFLLPEYGHADRPWWDCVDDFTACFVCLPQTYYISPFVISNVIHVKIQKRCVFFYIFSLYVCACKELCVQWYITDILLLKGHEVIIQNSYRL